jgi:hypothetical protein
VSKFLVLFSWHLGSLSLPYFNATVAFVIILVEDIPLCLSIILKWNKIYTSSNTTILFFINLTKYKIVVFEKVYILFHFNIIAFAMLHSNIKDFQHLKKKAICSLETSKNSNPAKQCQVPEDRNPTLPSPPRPLKTPKHTHRLPIKCTSEISCSHIQATCPCKVLRPFQDHYFDALCQRSDVHKPRVSGRPGD